MTTFTKLGLIAILLGTTSISLAAPIQAAQVQSQSTPKSVLNQFYKGYVSQKKYWRDMKNLIDPVTYDQLIRVPLIDVEPFTDTQVRTWSYTIGNPQIKGNEAIVPVRLMIGLRYPEVAKNLSIVLRKNGNQWQIRNVIYSAKPLPSGEPNDLLHLWKPTALSEEQVIDLIAKLPEVQQMRKAVESYQGEKLRLGMSIDQAATASNPVTTVGVYEHHSTHRVKMQRFLVNTQTQEIRVVDPSGRGSIALEEWRNRK